VDEDGCGACFCIVSMLAGGARASSGEDVEVVVVVAGDGEVPHPASGDLGDPAPDDGGCASVRGMQVVAVAQGPGLDPAPAVPACGWDPEEVAAGGINDCGAVVLLDFQVVEIGVAVDDDSGDGLRLGLAGPSAGRQDLVAHLEASDGDDGAGS